MAACQACVDTLGSKKASIEEAPDAAFRVHVEAIRKPSRAGHVRLIVYQEGQGGLGRIREA